MELRLNGIAFLIVLSVSMSHHQFTGTLTYIVCSPDLSTASVTSISLQ